MVSRLWFATIVFAGFLSCQSQAQSLLALPVDEVISNADLDALRSAPTPKKQDDLDTEKLASAPRDHAASIEERTDGLWQSWRVSICQGCGVDEQPPGERVKAYFKPREVTSQAEPTMQPIRTLRPQKQRRTASLYTDLSNENIDQIRWHRPQ